MHILLTNDDGVEAPGLEALVAAVRCLPASFVVVAPLLPHSGCGHRVTTDRPLSVTSLAPDRYAVDGTPADCVRLGISRLTLGVDLVLSGINAGGNLGVDVHHSGTVAAAREAAMHGHLAVAVSQYHQRGTDIDWTRAAAWLTRVLLLLPLTKKMPGEFWNINFPATAASPCEPAIVECAIDPSPFALNYLSDAGGWHSVANYHQRPRVPGSDVDVCFGGSIALSRGRVL